MPSPPKRYVPYSGSLLTVSELAGNIDRRKAEKRMPDEKPQRMRSGLPSAQFRRQRLALRRRRFVLGKAGLLQKRNGVLT